MAIAGRLQLPRETMALVALYFTFSSLSPNICKLIKPWWLFTTKSGKNITMHVTRTKSFRHFGIKSKTWVAERQNCIHQCPRFEILHKRTVRAAGSWTQLFKPCFNSKMAAAWIGVYCMFTSSFLVLFCHPVTGELAQTSKKLPKINLDACKCSVFKKLERLCIYGKNGLSSTLNILCWLVWNIKSSKKLTRTPIFVPI